MAERTTDIEIPDRYRYAVVPHIMVDDAAAAIDFYRRAFGAREDFRVDAPGGGILHAEITVAQEQWPDIVFHTVREHAGLVQQRVAAA